MLELNTSQVADLLGVTQRQVANYKTGPNPIPVIANYGGSRGTSYDANAVLKWWLSRKVRSSNDDLLDPQQEKAKLDKARRVMVEMDAKKRSGELVEESEAIKAIERLAFEVKSKILAAPSRYAHQMIDAKDLRDSSARLSKMCREILTELSASGDKC